MIKIQLQKVDIPPGGVHLALNVTLNEKQVRMVVDTGASRSVLDLHFFQELFPDTVLNEEESDSAGVGASGLSSFTSLIPSLYIESFEVKEYELALMDLSHVKASYLHLGEEAIHGVLGGDILERLKAMINYADSSLTLLD
tara:strand:- start:25949 stop:26371 length:423 start_codon:yes stop_codon:yes gene_type:complete